MTPLRIGVVVRDANDLSIGERRLLEGLCADERFNLQTMFVSKERPSAPSRLFQILMRLEAGVLARRRHFSAPVFEAMRNDVDVVALSGKARPRLANASFDVIVDMAGLDGADAVAHGAKFGVWSLTAYEPLAGFWEADANAAATMVELIGRSSPQGPCEKIAEAAYNTKFIASRNAAFVREKSVQLVLRELARLWLEGRAASTGTPRSRPAAPTAPELARYFAKLGVRLAKRGLRTAAARAGLRPGMWVVKFGEGDALSFDPSAAKEAAPRGDKYWADPFLIQKGEGCFVFFEDYDYRTKRGHISVGQIEAGAFRLIGPALITDYHLSFPFVFAAGSETFMIPETHQTRRVEVWRCVEFPSKWTLHATALKGRFAADTVLADISGEWWMFTNITNDSYGDHCSELHLFRVDGPRLETVAPHPLNPVVIDARTARNGGRVFAKDGRLFRISQNNAYGEYGYGFNIMEIERLDMAGYSEKPVRRVGPEFEAGLMGCHHFDAAGGAVVFDARRKWGGLSR